MRSRTNWRLPTLSGSGGSVTPCWRALASTKFMRLTNIDPWFLANIEELISLEVRLRQFQTLDRRQTC